MVFNAEDKTCTRSRDRSSSSTLLQSNSRTGGSLRPFITTLDIFGSEISQIVALPPKKEKKIKNRRWENANSIKRKFVASVVLCFPNIGFVSEAES
jgi:hypothetical protein